MFGKTFRYELLFDTVYNKAAHENMKHFGNAFFIQFTQKINLFEIAMQVHEPALYQHTSIYQTGPFKCKLLVRTLHN